MPASIFGNPAAVVQLNQALFGIAPGNGKYTNQLDQANAIGAIPFARQLGQTVAASNESLAATVLANVGIVNATLQTALVQAFAAFPNDRGVVVLNLTNILTTLEGNAVYGAAAAQFNAQVATDFQYSTNPVNTADSPINAGTATLTANTDILTGNLFTAGLVFTPGGDDRINSLQDEDTLTGTGTNATLNATLGNANDNGAPIITPTISNVSTFNVSFSGSGAAAVNELDLQDTTGTITNLNINRINDGIATARIDNIGNAVANLSVSRSGQVAQNVDFAFTAGALAGAADSTTLTLNQVNLNNLFVEERLTNFDEGFETINLVSAGTSPNAAVLFQAEDLQTLNISGGARLTIGGTASTTGPQGIEATRYNGGLGQVAGSLTAINASTFTAALDIVLGAELIAGLDGTSGQPVNLTVTGGSGNDTFRLAAGTAIQAGDRIIGGAAAGTDTNTLQLLGNNVVSTDGTAANGPTVTRVQSLDIRNGQDAGVAADATTVDARAIADLSSVVIRNEGQDNPIPANGFVSAAEVSTVTLNNVNAATANGIVVLHGTSGNSGIANNNIVVASTLAGVTTGGLTIRDATNNNPQFNVNVTFDSDGTAGNATNAIVNVNLVDQDTESNTVRLNEFQRETGTLNITGTGNTGNFFNLDSTGNAYRYAQDGSNNNGVVGAPGARAEVGAGAAERLQFATIDSTTYLGNVVARVGLDVTPTTNGAQTVRFGSGNDTVIFDVLNDTRAGFSIADTISGGAGTDVLAIDGNGARITLQASEFENTTGFEVLRFIGNDVAAISTAFSQNSINVALSDAYITNNAAGGKVITIINDNDSRNDTAVPTAAQQTAETAANGAGVAALNAASQSEGITLDLRTLSAGFGINYNGEEGTAAATAGVAAPGGPIIARTTSADRFIFADRNIDSVSIIDGGSADNVSQVGVAYNRATDGVRNADVLEVRNSADVSTGDLQNIRNVGTLAFNVDTAAAQTFTLQLNDAVIDNLVDSFHTASATQQEDRVIVDADDGTVTGAALGAAQITLDASQVTANTAFDFRDDNAGTTANDRVIVAARVAGQGNLVSFTNAADVYEVRGTSTTATLVDVRFADGALTQANNGLTFTTTGASATDTIVSPNGATYDLSTYAGIVQAILSEGTTTTITRGTQAVDDRVVILGNYNNGTYAAGVNEFGVSINNQFNGLGGVQRAVTDVLNLGAGNDTLVTYGDINIAGLVLTGVENYIANSNVTMTETQFRNFTSVQFSALVGAHTLTITNDGSAGAIDLSKVTLLGAGGLVISNQSGDATSNAANTPGGGLVVAGVPGGPLTVALATALALDLTAFNPITVTATGAQITAAAGVGGTIAANDVAQPGEIDFVDATDNVLTLTNAQFGVLTNARLTLADAVTVADTGANLTQGVLNTLIAAANVDTIDATNDVLTINAATSTAKLVAGDVITLADTGAATAAVLTAAQADAKIDVIDTTNDVLTVTAAQFTAGTGKLVAGDVITLADTGVATAAVLTAAQADAKIDVIDTADNVLTVTAAQFAAGTGKLVAGDVITLADTGAATAAQLTAALGDAKVDVIDTTNDLLTLTAAQFALGTAKLVAGDVITLADTGAATAAQLTAALGDAKIDAIDTTNDVLTVTAAQFALGTAKLAAADVVTLVDTAAATNAALTAVFADAKIDTIDANDSTTAATALIETVAQALVAANQAKLVAGDFVTVSGTGADIVTNLAAFVADTKIDSFNTTNNAVTLTAAQFATTKAFAADDVITFQTIAGQEIVADIDAAAAGGAANKLIKFAGGTAGTAVFADVANNTTIADTDTFTGTFDTFGGFDAAGDKVDLTSFALAANNNATQFTASASTVTNAGYIVVRGGYAGNVFTANAAGADSLVLWDADTSAAIAQVGVVLTGVVATAADLLV